MSISQFFIPYQFQTLNKSFLQTAVEIVDSYLFLGGEKILITEIKGQELRTEIMESYPSFLSTCLKVLSYFSIVLPCLALVTKYFLREMLPQYQIQLEAPNIEEKVPVPEILDPLQLDSNIQESLFQDIPSVSQATLENVPAPVIPVAIHPQQEQEKKINDYEAVIAAIDQGREAILALVRENKIDLSAGNDALVKLVVCLEDIELTQLLLLDKGVSSDVLDLALQLKKNPMIYALLANKRVIPIASILLIEWATENGEEGITALLANPNFQSTPRHSSELVHWACTQDKPDLLRALLAHPAIHQEMYQLSQYLVIACDSYCSEIALILMEVATIDLTAFNCLAFKRALKYGLTKVVEKFMETIDPSTENNFAIKNAGNRAIAKLLLADPRVTPTLKALHQARDAGRNDVEEELLKDERIKDAVVVMNE